jgi:hypothetical protein
MVSISKMVAAFRTYTTHRVSAQNCGNIYNNSLGKLSAAAQPTIWPQGTNPCLTSEQVWHAFFRNALLRDSAERGVTLVLPDAGDHDSRLRRAMELRNSRIIRHGQPYKMHACSICEKFIPGLGYCGLSKLFLSGLIQFLFLTSFYRVVTCCCC